MESQNVEELQILHDFKLFIREGLFFDCSGNLLHDFACSMDNLYYPYDRKYYIELVKILKQKELLFSPSNNDLINDNHLEKIKEFIKDYMDRYNLKRISKDYIKKINVSFCDFKLCIEQKKMIYLSDLYYFAHYMKAFYPKYPYYEVANLLCSMDGNNNGLIDIDFYLNFFNSECINLKDFYYGHAIEIWNFTREKNILYYESNKKLLKE